MKGLYRTLTPEQMAANVARERAVEVHRRDARAARNLLLADLPWLGGTSFPTAATWRTLVDLAIQPTGPFHAWFWGGEIPSDGDCMILPAGTPLDAPLVVVHGPPVGAHLCEPVPEDGRDDEEWWNFRLQAPSGTLRAGAPIEMRPGHGVVIVPDGHGAIGDPVITARAVLALDAQAPGTASVRGAGP